MADVKINRRHICGDDDFRVTSGDLEEESSQYYALTHDETDAKAVIGYGSKITNHVDPRVLADDEYFDLPSASYGTGFILIGDVDQYVRFVWNSVGQVTLIENTSLVDDANTDGYFCLYDTGDTTRISNRLGYAVRIVFEYSYSDNGSAPLFQVFNAKSGVDNLDPYLTINSTTVAPTFRFKGGDAGSSDWAAWTFGNDLSKVAGSPILNDGSPCLGNDDDSVMFNDNTYYQGSGDSGYITTEDFVVELVFQYSETVNDYLIGNWNTGTSLGWLLYTPGAGSFRLFMDDGTGTAFVTASTLTDGAWYHLMVFVNRDEASANSCSIYVNSVSLGTGDISSMNGTLASSDLTIGAAANGVNFYGYRLAYVSMWKQASWHQAGASGPSEWATIAAERFAKLCGYYPEIAHDTYLPTVNTRAFDAYLDKMEGSVRKLYYVGSEWLRMCHRVDGNGVNVRGYLPESQNTNILSHSEEFSVGWTKLDAGDTFNDAAAVCPDGRTAAASLVADSTDGGHGFRIQPTVTAATYTFSVYAKPGSGATYGNDWICLYNNTVAGATCYFDVANGVKGTEGIGCDGYIEGPFYSGDSEPYYRCCIVFTGTAAVHDLRIYSCEADNDLSFAGNGSDVNVFVWGGQCEQSDYMSSPMITSGATQTRLKDQLRYVAGGNIGGEDVGAGTVVADILLSDYDIGSPSTLYFYTISDGGAVADRVASYIAADELFYSITRATAGNNGDVSVNPGDCADGIKHDLQTDWDTDALTLYRDEVQGTTDSSADMPDDLDRMDVGHDSNAGNHFDGLIQNFRTYQLGGR